MNAKIEQSLLNMCVEIGKLNSDKENARSHDYQSISVIKRSLEQFGQQKPIVVDNGMNVIAGNGTLEAAIDLGWEKIAIVKSDLNKKNARAFAIADNRTTDKSEFSDDILLQQLSEMDAKERESAGFSESEFNELFAIASIGEFEGVGDVGEVESEKRELSNQKKNIRIVVLCDQVAIIEAAIVATGLKNRQEAIIAICRSYIENEERQFDPEIQSILETQSLGAIGSASKNY